jgi:hypothetical protein
MSYANQYLPTLFPPPRTAKHTLMMDALTVNRVVLAGCDGGGAAFISWMVAVEGKQTGLTDRAAQDWPFSEATLDRHESAFENVDYVDVVIKK